MKLEYYFNTTKNIVYNLCTFNFKKAFKQLQNIIHVTASQAFGAEGEIDLPALNAFEKNFSDNADLKIISIGSYGYKSQQFYPFLSDYAHNDKTVQIHLFDPYFYHTNDANAQYNTYTSFTNGPTEAPAFFFDDGDSMWQSVSPNSYKHKSLDITIYVYKALPGWGFETIADLWLPKVLEPHLLTTLQHGQKVFISQHTGGAAIHKSIIDTYNVVCKKLEGDSKKNDTEDFTNNFVLFGSQVSGQVQYYDHGSFIEADQKTIYRKLLQHISNILKIEITQQMIGDMMTDNAIELLKLIPEYQCANSDRKTAFVDAVDNSADTLVHGISYDDNTSNITPIVGSDLLD